MSPRINQLFGFPVGSHPTIHEIRARYHSDDRERVADETAAALNDPSAGFVRNRFRVIRGDGTIRWLEARGKIYRDGQGRAVRTIGVMLDITDQKATEAALEESWRRFEQALANTTVVVFQQDRALRYTWVHNPKLGYDAQSVLGKTDADLMPLELAGRLEAIKRKVIETGRSAREEVTTQGSEGRGQYDLYIEPKRDTEGSIIGITCAAIEIPRAEGAKGNAPGREQALRDRDYLLDRIGTRSRGGVGGKGLFTVCMNALRRKLGGYALLTPAEAATLSELETKRRFLAAKREVALTEPAAHGATWLIGNGWVYCYKLLSAGDRQIISFHVPGDTIAVDGRAGHTYATITDCVFCEIDNRALNEIKRSQTKLAGALDWSAARDQTILEQHLVTIGRRSAIARVAHLMLELHARLQLVGQADDDGFRCPLSQEMIGDALGLTNIHVNRMLRQLRELGCLTFRHGYVRIENLEHLVEIAEFDPTYLNHNCAAEASAVATG